MVARSRKEGAIVGEVGSRRGDRGRGRGILRGEIMRDGVGDGLGVWVFVRFSLGLNLIRAQP